MDLTQIISNTIANQVAQGVSKKLNLPADQSQNVVNMALPVILGGLAKNAQNPDNAQVLHTTLKKNHKNGAILTDIPTATAQDATQTEGAKIIGHIFGNNSGAVSDTIGSQTNVNPSQVAQIMSIAAPFVLGALAKKQQTDNLSPTELSNTLQQTASDQLAQTPQNQSIINQLLDQNHDGSIVDDVVGMGVKALGNIFKK